MFSHHAGAELFSLMKSIEKPNKRAGETEAPTRRNFPRSPFARFEAQLAKERREERLKQDVEIVGSVPKPRRHMREKDPKPDRHGNYPMMIPVDPRATLKAALIAVREQSTTSAVIRKWIEEEIDEIEHTECPSVSILLGMAIGPSGFPADLAEEVNQKAAELGVDPSALISAFIKLGLRKRKEELGIA